MRMPIAAILRMQIFFLRPMRCIYGTGTPAAFAQKYYEQSASRYSVAEPVGLLLD
jgi:hypothetical protein